jgi:hypothetical protein
MIPEEAPMSRFLLLASVFLIAAVLGLPGPAQAQTFNVKDFRVGG